MNTFPMMKTEVDQLRAELDAALARTARAEAEVERLQAVIDGADDNRDAAVIVEAANHLREAANAMLLEWRMAAHRVGEQLADTGTVDYYLMSPAEWQAWALEAIDARRAEGKANVRGPFIRKREEAPAE